MVMDKLRYLFPDENSYLFGVYDSGNGQTILDWKQNFPQPTQAELDAVTEADILAFDTVKARAMMCVSLWQIRKALNQQGMRDVVEQLVAGASIEIQDGWKYATEFRRLNPFVVFMGQQAGLTDTQLDNLFKLAGSL